MPEQQKKKLKLTYDEYKTMSNLIVYFMRKKEAEFEGRWIRARPLECIDDYVAVVLDLTIISMA